MCVGVRCNVLVMGRARTRANQATVYGPGFYLYTALLPPRRASYYIQPERGIITRRSQIGEVHNRLCLPCPQKKTVPSRSSSNSVVIYFPPPLLAEEGRHNSNDSARFFLLLTFLLPEFALFLDLQFCGDGRKEGPRGKGK